MTPTVPNSHVYVLLDRSGSMGAVAGDVIGSFNAFLAQQQADGDDAVFTLVQFDTVDPHEVVADAVPVAEMVDLTAATYQPRSGTPLLDATGELITRARIRQQTLASVGASEAVTFVTFTDGLENSSVRYSRDQIRTLVQELTDAGWTFVFVGADPGTYHEAGGLGYDARSVMHFDADPGSVHLAMSGASDALRRKRARLRSGLADEHRDFFEGEKATEQAPSKPETSQPGTSLRRPKR